MTWYDIQIESRRLPPLRPLPVRPIVPVPNPSSTSSSAFSSAAAYRHMLHGSNGNATTNGTKRASASVDEALSSGPMHKKVKSETYITVLDESNRPQQPSASAFSSHSMNAPPQRLRATRCSRGSACCKQSNRGENVGGKSVREEVEFSLLTIGFMGVGHPEVVPPLGLLVRDYSAATRGYQTAPQQQLIGNTGHLTSHSPIMHSPPSPPLPGSAGLGGGMNTPLSHPRGSHAHALHARPHIHSVSSPTAGSLLTSWLSHGRHSPHHPHRPPLPHPASTHLPAHNPDSSAALAAHAVAQNIASIPISPVFSALSDHAVVYSPRHPWQIEARLSAKATFSGIDLSCPPSPVSPTPPTFLDIRSVQCRSPIISPSNPSLDISLQGHEAEFLESGDSSSDSELLSAFPPGHGNQMIIAKPKFSSYRHAPEDLSRAKISWWLRGIENSQGFRSEWPPSKKTGPVALSGYVDQVDLSSDETCPSDPIFFGEKDLSDLVSDEETELSYLTFDHP